MSIRLEMTFDTVEEMLAVFTAKILPTTAASLELPPPTVKEEPKKAAAPKPVKAEKPAATQPASETATPGPTEPAASEPAAASPSEPAPQPDNSVKITLEFVRAKLADLSKSGKGPQVKALIAETGADNLSAVPAEKYAELLNKAAAL